MTTKPNCIIIFDIDYYLATGKINIYLNIPKACHLITSKIRRAETSALTTNLSLKASEVRIQVFRCCRALTKLMSSRAGGATIAPSSKKPGRALSPQATSFCCWFVTAAAVKLGQNIKRPHDDTFEKLLVALFLARKRS